MLAQTSGQLCDFSQLGDQIGLDHKTVGKYLAVFKQMFLMQHVPVWSTSRLGRLIEILKLQISVVPESQGRSVSRRHASADFFRSLVGASRPSSTTVSSHEGCPAATLVARSGAERLRSVPAAADRGCSASNSKAAGNEN